MGRGFLRPFATAADPAWGAHPVRPIGDRASLGRHRRAGRCLRWRSPSTLSTERRGTARRTTSRRMTRATHPPAMPRRPTPAVPLAGRRSPRLGYLLSTGLAGHPRVDSPGVGQRRPVETRGWLLSSVDGGAVGSVLSIGVFVVVSLCSLLSIVVQLFDTGLTQPPIERDSETSGQPKPLRVILYIPIYIYNINTGHDCSAPLTDYTPRMSRRFAH